MDLPFLSHIFCKTLVFYVFFGGSSEESSEVSVSPLNECICDVTFVSTVLPDVRISVISTCTLRWMRLLCFYHWIIVTVLNWKFFISYQYCKCDFIGLFVVFRFRMSVYFSAVKKNVTQLIIAAFIGKRFLFSLNDVNIFTRSRCFLH